MVMSSPANKLTSDTEEDIYMRSNGVVTDMGQDRASENNDRSEGENLESVYDRMMKMCDKTVVNYVESPSSVSAYDQMNFSDNDSLPPPSPKHNSEDEFDIVNSPLIVRSFKETQQYSDMNEENDSDNTKETRKKFQNLDSTPSEFDLLVQSNTPKKSIKRSSKQIKNVPGDNCTLDHAKTAMNNQKLDNFDLLLKTKSFSTPVRHSSKKTYPVSPEEGLQYSQDSSPLLLRRNDSPTNFEFDIRSPSYDVSIKKSYKQRSFSPEVFQISDSSQEKNLIVNRSINLFNQNIIHSKIPGSRSSSKRSSRSTRSNGHGDIESPIRRKPARRRILYGFEDKDPIKDPAIIETKFVPVVFGIGKQKDVIKFPFPFPPKEKVGFTQNILKKWKIQNDDNIDQIERFIPYSPDWANLWLELPSGFYTYGYKPRYIETTNSDESDSENEVEETREDMFSDEEMSAQIFNVDSLDPPLRRRNINPSPDKSKASVHMTTRSTTRGPIVKQFYDDFDDFETSAKTINAQRKILESDWEDSETPKKKRRSRYAPSLEKDSFRSDHNDRNNNLSFKVTEEDRSVINGDPLSSLHKENTSKTISRNLLSQSDSEPNLDESYLSDDQLDRRRGAVDYSTNLYLKDDMEKEKEGFEKDEKYMSSQEESEDSLRSMLKLLSSGGKIPSSFSDISNLRENLKKVKKFAPDKLQLFKEAILKLSR